MVRLRYGGNGVVEVFVPLAVTDVRGPVPQQPLGIEAEAEAEKVESGMDIVVFAGSEPYTPEDVERYDGRGVVVVLVALATVDEEVFDAVAELGQ